MMCVNCCASSTASWSEPPFVSSPLSSLSLDHFHLRPSFLSSPSSHSSWEFLLLHIYTTHFSSLLFTSLLFFVSFLSSLHHFSLLCHLITLWMDYLLFCNCSLLIHHCCPILTVIQHFITSISSKSPSTPFSMKYFQLVLDALPLWMIYHSLDAVSLFFSSSTSTSMWLWTFISILFNSLSLTLPALLSSTPQSRPYELFCLRSRVLGFGPWVRPPGSALEFVPLVLRVCFHVSV